MKPRPCNGRNNARRRHGVGLFSGTQASLASSCEGFVAETRAPLGTSTSPVISLLSPPWSAANSLFLLVSGGIAPVLVDLDVGRVQVGENSLGLAGKQRDHLWPQPRLAPSPRTSVARTPRPEPFRHVPTRTSTRNRKPIASAPFNLTMQPFIAFDDTA